MLHTAGGTDPTYAISTSAGILHITPDSGTNDVVSIEVAGPVDATFANGLHLNPNQSIATT